MPGYKNKDWLKKEYYDKNKTLSEMAEECGVCQATIRNWMEKLGIKRRTSAEMKRIRESLARENVAFLRRFPNELD